MTRFFVTPDELNEKNPRLTGENGKHASVLRLRAGEEVILCDGRGQECRCSVLENRGGEYILETIERRKSPSEPEVLASIYMAYAKGDKLEHVIQKATELGAYEIVVFPSARCVSRPEEKSLGKKLERWQKIARSAAEQSGRGWIPQVIALESFAQALARATQTDLSILFYENEHANTLRHSLEKASFHTVSLLTGPEGGLEEREVQEAERAGLQICTLGSRILRCETAPLCALSAVMFASGEF